MCFTTATHNNRTVRPKVSATTKTQTRDSYCQILPGLPDDVAKSCLVLVPQSDLPVMGSVCKKWRAFIQSKEFCTVRKEFGKLEERLYVLTADAEGKGSHWELLGSVGDEHHKLPPMPGPAKVGFGVAALNGKLLVMAGYVAEIGTGCVSADVFQYDCRLNSWSKLARMNVARFHFACTEVDGVVYVAGGYSADGDCLSSVEAYDPEKNEWTLIESLRRPRWGCFACSFEGRVYVMGGRSAFTIGHSKSVDVYNPGDRLWLERKNGCVMVTAHASIGRRLFCMEWKRQRKLAVFDLAANSWNEVAVPLTGSSAVGFRFGILDGKLLLFSASEEPGYQTLVYDPEAKPGSEWQTTPVRPPAGVCLCSVTIKA